MYVWLGLLSWCDYGCVYVWLGLLSWCDYGCVYVWLGLLCLGVTMVVCTFGWGCCHGVTWKEFTSVDSGPSAINCAVH